MLLILAFTMLAGLAFAAVLYQIDVQQPAPPINIPTTTETIAAQGLAVTCPNPNGKAVIRAWVELSVGAGTTAITLTVYAGNAIGGRVVGTRQPEAGDFTPGSAATFDLEFIDPFNNVSGVQYCVSVQQTGATGNGTVQNALISTMVLSG